MWAEKGGLSLSYSYYRLTDFDGFQIVVRIDDDRLGVEGVPSYSDDNLPR